MARPPGVTEFLTTDQILSLPRWQDPLTEQERKALIQIAANPKIGPKEVGESIRAEKDVMSRIIKKLVGLGLLFERKNPDDRRYTQLGMTEAGKAAMYEWVAYKFNKRPGTFRIEDIFVWTGEDTPSRTQP